MEEGIHVYITQKHSFSKGGKSSRLHFAEPVKKQESKAQKRALALPQRKRRCSILLPLNFVSFVKIRLYGSHLNNTCFRFCGGCPFLTKSSRALAFHFPFV
jgi:hypothetical protein